MEGHTLIIKNLRKVYPNGTEAVKGISFSIKKGEIFGLVGPNGAGKSTTIKMIATLLKPTGGEIIVDGVEAVKNPFEARKHLAYLPESISGEKDVTVEEFLNYLATLYSINTGKDPDRMVKNALKISALEDHVEKKIGELSKGMFRRLMIGTTLMLDTPLIVLDEPTSGVDILENVRIREIIRAAAREGKSVLLSSHNMLEVEALCDRIALMHRGKILKTGTPEEIRGNHKTLDEAFSALLSGGDGG